MFFKSPEGHEPCAVVRGESFLLRLASAVGSVLTLCVTHDPIETWLGGLPF